MSRRRFFVISVFLFCFLVQTRDIFAIDLGGTTSGSEELQKVQVMNTNEEPVPVAERGTSEVHEIIRETQLSMSETYESPYMDVRDYRNVTFYVIPQKALNEPHPDIRYKLDAFFSVDAGTATYKKAGDRDDKISGEGFQEFGSKVVRDEAPPGQPYFNYLTTGDTAARVLSTPVYGPFVRVVLTSLTAADRRKFRIVAYLSR